MLIYHTVKRHPLPFILSLLVLMLFAAFSIIYRVYPSFYDNDFWQNTVSNFIATFLGLLFGIPIALWIDSIQKEAIDDKEKSKSIEEAKQRKRKVINSLRVELNGVYQLLKDYPGYRITTDSFDWLYFHATAPAVEVWRAFSDGGELQWIDDADLLMSLAWAYHAIGQIKNSGELLIDSAFIHHPRAGKVITEHIHEHFENNIRDGITILKDALDKIDSQN